MAHESVKVLGTTDTITSCECCGRKNLKKTVAISIDDADPVYFGTSCAARAVKWTAADIRRAAKKADKAIADKAAAEARAKRQAADQVWFAWLNANTPAKLRGEVFLQIESLGGYRAARDRFDAENEKKID
jgi:hypothetical protein